MKKYDTQNNSQNIEQLLTDASEKLKVNINWLRNISPQEILYLLDRCPFLQMVNPEVSLEEQQLELLMADSGWTIHLYGDAMSSSPGELLFGGGDYRIFLSEEEDEEGGGGSILNPGKGTIRKQAFDTAMQMAEFAYQLGWGAIQIIDGHPIMGRAAWIRAEQLGLTVSGFTPTKRDIEIRNRIELSPSAIDALLKTIRLTR